MKLLTKELLKKLPPLYSQENVEDPMVICKFFLPNSHWRWYVTEFDGKDTFFGYVVGNYPELGYFSLSELEEIRTPITVDFGGGKRLTHPHAVAVERDLYFEPCRLSEVKGKEVV